MAPCGRHSIAIVASSTRLDVQELNAEPPGGFGAVAAGPLRPAAVLSFYRTRRAARPGYRACPVTAALAAEVRAKAAARATERVLMSGRVILCSIRGQPGMAF